MLNFFYHFLSILPTFTILLFLFMVWRTSEEKLLGQIFLLYLSVSLLEYLYFFDYLLKGLDYSFPVLLAVAEMFLFVSVLLSLKYYIYTLYCLQEPLLFSLIFMALALLPLILYFSIGDRVARILFFLELIYLIGFFFRHLGELDSSTLKRPLRIFFVILSLFLPVFLSQLILDYAFDYYPSFLLIVTYLLIRNIWILWLRGAVKDNPKDEEAMRVRYNITDRELDVIKLVVQGKSNTDIGGQLFISEKTVTNHLYNIYRKIGIKSRFELMTKFRI